MKSVQAKGAWEEYSRAVKDEISNGNCLLREDAIGGRMKGILLSLNANQIEKSY